MGSSRGSTILYQWRRKRREDNSPESAMSFEKCSDKKIFKAKTAGRQVHAILHLLVPNSLADDPPNGAQIWGLVRATVQRVSHFRSSRFPRGLHAIHNVRYHGTPCSWCVIENRRFLGFWNFSIPAPTDQALGWEIQLLLSLGNQKKESLWAK